MEVITPVLQVKIQVRRGVFSGIVPLKYVLYLCHLFTSSIMLYEKKTL